MEDNPPLTSLLKEASESLVNEYSEKLPHSAFADDVNLRFPINTPEMAKLSYYYAKSQDVGEPVLTKISQALELFGEEVPVISTGSLPNNNFLLPKYSAYPANNSEEVKLAEAYFNDYGYSFNINDRREYCKNLIKTAMKVDYNPSLFSDIIKRYAGVTGTSLSKLALELDARSQSCEAMRVSPYYKEAYQSIKKACLELSKDDEVYDKPKDFSKVAHAIEELDSLSGLSQLYSVNFNDPDTAVFNLSKLAETSIAIDGEFIPYSMLLRLTKREYQDILGPDFAKEIYDGDELNIENLKSIVPTLPLDMKRGLVRYAKRY
jgi:hypothetical protein